MAEITYADISNILGKPEWTDGLRVDAIQESFFGPGMRGKPGSGAVVIVHNPPGGAAGVAVDVPLLGNLEGDGVEGETALEGNEEVISNSHQTVTPDIQRHGVANTRKVRWASAVDLATFARNALSQWVGRKRDRMILAKILATVKRLFGGDATSRATLSSDDTFGTAELTRGRLYLQRIGAQPLRVETDPNGRKIPYYGAMITAVDEANLKTDPIWQQAHRNVAELAEKNPLYSGALGEWDGVIVYPYNELAGSGSALRPETVVNGALAIDAVTITVGGAKAGVDYTKYFPTSGTLLIGAEKIAYTGKTSTSFTGCTRASGGTVAAAHADGDLITLNNLTSQVFFGAEAIAEGLGQDAQFKLNNRDYDNKQGIGVEMIDGYEVVVDTTGKPANLVVMECYGVSPT